MTHELLTFELIEGEPIEITVNGAAHTLEPGTPLEVPAER
jgi:hypothetical protein